MTSSPPPSPDGSSLPQRQRPSVENLASDTTELDLWAFDDDQEAAVEGMKPMPGEAPRASAREIPAPRSSNPPPPPRKENRTPARASLGGEGIRINVNKQGMKARAAEPEPAAAKPEPEFEDLEAWEDTNRPPEVEDLPPEGLPETSGPALRPERIAAEESAPDTEPEASLPAVADDDEFSPAAPPANATPLSLRPHLRLTKVERIGLIALLVLVIGGGGSVFFLTLTRLPGEASTAGVNDFPIKGSHVTASSAVTYWRKPTTEGPEADTVRRGTELLPVLELKVSGGPAAIRVLFRNEDRLVVGDAVSRAVTGDGVLKIPATSGFDDLGMHAAYRTGESKPWTIEVHEAASPDAAGKDFKKLFEINISTDRR